MIQKQRELYVPTFCTLPIILIHSPFYLLQLTSKLNPDCPPNYCGTRDRQNIITVVHIQADGFYDSIHYIWDLTGIPSILMVRTELNTSMSLDWEKFLNDESDCLTFSKKPFYSSTVIINKVNYIKINKI